MNIFKITIPDLDNPEMGLLAVSLVDFPAVEKDFLAFEEEQQPIMMRADEERHVITGVALLADTPIYRKNLDNGNPCYIVFDKETIEALVTKYAREGRNNVVTLQHEGSTISDAICTMFESYLVDKERGICPKEFSDVPDGSWIVSYKVNDMALWDEIKSGNTLKGFSVECRTAIAPANLAEEKEEDEIDTLIDEILLESEIERIEKDGDVAEAMAKYGDRQLEVKIDGKKRRVQVYEIAKLNGKEVAQVYYPKQDFWEVLPLADLEEFKITTAKAVEFNTNAYGYRVKIDAPPVIPSNIADQIKMAIQMRMPVSLTYDDESEEGCTGSRSVMIVAFGRLKNGSEGDAIRVYEYDGATHHVLGGLDSWRLLRLDRLQSLRFMEAWERIKDTPEGYVMGDSAMSQIYAQLEA